MHASTAKACLRRLSDWVNSVSRFQAADRSVIFSRYRISIARGEYGYYQLVVLLNNSNAPHGAMNDRRERRGKVGGAASFKILGRGGVTSGEDASGIVERHLFEGD